MAIKYDNFDLLIERSGDEFKARVLESPAGEATTHFQLPYTETEIENFYIQIGHTRLIESSEMQKMRLFGQELFEATFTGNVRDKFRESLAEVNRKREGLRIRLRLSDVPELANMPWEFMYDASLSRFLTLSIETPLVRYLDVPRDIQPLTIRPPLRILVVISSPRNFPTLNVQREWENLREALQGLESRGLVKLTRLEKPTLQALQRQLRRGEYHIFHFIGHGIFSKHLQDGQLLFEDEIKGGDPVSSRDLGIILHDHKQLRLAVLNACEGARTSLEDQFSGTAQSLILQGLPAVIAMQFRITDIAAITMAREFYSALADGYPVDASLTEARKSIKTHGNELEWGTPVLYMRSPDGAIFDVKNLPPRSPVEKPIDSIDQDKEKRLTALYTEGLEAYYLKEWERAISKFETIIDEQPGYKDAVAKLEFAQKSLDLASLDKQAKAAETKGNWVTAVEVLEKILKDFPEQETFSQRLKHAQKQKHLSSLYDEARQLAQAEKWETVVHVFNELHTQDPHYPDPENLLAQAEEVVRAEKTQREVEKLYRNALEAIGAKNWPVAQQTLQQIQSEQANYRETERLLETVSLEIERTEKKAEEMERIASLYVQAENLVDRKQWQKALDKIEEILNIQPDFDDPKQIWPKVSTELEKNRQEEEKQNRLAELYAEAVKLNRDGEYQQALEIWNQIRTLDSTYPDKQHVQANSQRMLKRSTQSESIIQKFTWRPKITPGWGILIAGILWYAFKLGELSFTGLFNINNVAVRELLHWSLFGITTGLLNLLVFRFFNFEITNKKNIILVVGWVIGSLATPIIVWLFPDLIFRYYIGYTLSGIFYGLVLHYTLPNFPGKPSLSTLVFAFGFGMFAGDSSYIWFRDAASIPAPHYSVLTLGVAAIVSGSIAFGKIAVPYTVDKSKVSIEKTSLTIAGILIAARLLGSFIGKSIETIFLNPIDIHWESSPYLILNIYYVLFAIFAAWLLIRLLKYNLHLTITNKEMTILTSSWTIGMVITSFFCVYLGVELETDWGWRIGWGIGGLVIGFGTWLATKSYSKRNKFRFLITAALGFGVGFFLSEQLSPMLQDIFIPIFGEQLGWEIAVNSNVGIAGLIGGFVLVINLTNERFSILKSKEAEEISENVFSTRIATFWQWLKVFLVFALSRAIINIIYNIGLLKVLVRFVGDTGTTIIYFLLFGFTTGLAIWLTLRGGYISSNKKTWIILSLTSSISITVFFTGALLAQLGTWSWTVAWIFIGICVGLMLANLLRSETPDLPKRLYWQIPIIWAFSFVIGQQIASEISLLIVNFAASLRDILTPTLETGIYGLVGSLLTIKLLGAEQNHKKRDFTITVGIFIVLLISFSLASGLQQVQKIFINEPFAGAIGNWQARDPSDFSNLSLSIRRSIFSGDYTITYFDDRVKYCHDGPASTTFTKKITESSFISSLILRCEDYKITTFALSNLKYDPEEDILTELANKNIRWERR